MAAYAALVSLAHIIDDLHRHPRPPISLHKQQIASLTAKIDFLQEFLESYNPRLSYSAEADPIEIEIADAAYAAEDAIESRIVDQITHGGENMSSDALYRDLEKVINDMASIEKKVVGIQVRKPTPSTSSLVRKLVLKVEVHDEREKQKAMKAVSTVSGIESVVIDMKEKKMTVVGDMEPLETVVRLRKAIGLAHIIQVGPKNRGIMVGADSALLEMKDKLTSHCRDLHIIPVVGMGGTGKTALAINISEDRLIKEHFDICAWATISQEYNIRQILIQILKQLIGNFNQGLSEGELGEMLYKHLYGRRYLVIIDDMWSIDAWDGVRRFFPSNENGSRIVVTTRLRNLASELSNSYSHEMSQLDEAHSWILLSNTVFGEKGRCPLELEDIGKKIGKSCKGLPLSIVTVGGLLSKSEQTREYWEYIEGHLNSIVNLSDDERCLKILYLSYKQLPVFLKPCFLYMGVFREDEAIRSSELIRIWVAEGFLKAVIGKSLEEVARACLESLIDRNLVMIDQKGCLGNIKYCRMHDLLRDMCLREAEKERFYTVVTTPPTRQGIANAAKRRIIISNNMSKNEAVEVVSSTPRARSLIWYHHEDPIPPPIGSSSMLLRVLHASKPFREGTEGSEEFIESVNRLVNARMLDLWFPPLRYNILWNMQTLCVHKSSMEITAPTDIWHMPHIRHLCFECGLHLPDPPSSQDDDVGWENLHTLKTINNLRCSKQVVKIIRNIKKLAIQFGKERLDGDRYCLAYLVCLDKLESLSCNFKIEMSPSGPDSLPSLISFPHSLKKLTLYINESPCSEEILEKIGLLPHLEKLQLLGAAFKESEWITTQGRFPSLKYLHLGSCIGLKVWTVESSHFPCLEHLRLDRIQIEIPVDFAEIATLRLIELSFCKASVLSSAKRILEEQEQLYGEEEIALQVQAFHYKKDEVHDNLASPNFRFTYIGE